MNMLTSTRVFNVLLGVILGMVAVVVLAFWLGNNQPSQTGTQNIDNGYEEYVPKTLRSGVTERIWVNPLVSENPNSLTPLEIDSDETVQNAYIVPAEYYKVAAMASNLGGFYTNHLDKGIDPVLASGDVSNEEYKRLALGKFHHIFKNIPILEAQIIQSKERNKGADFSGVEFTLVQAKRKINEAIHLYNEGRYGEADIEAFQGGVWVRALQDMLHEPVNEYQRLLTWYETDVDWARSVLRREDVNARNELEIIQEYLDRGDLYTARKLFQELETTNEVVRSVSIARDMSETNAQIWGALHWLAADLRAFETVNYDLLSESIPRYANNTISAEEVSRHQTVASCYVSVAGFVYDVTDLFKFNALHPAINSLQSRCGTDISSYIALQPVEEGSVNTARFKWILWWFEIGVLR